MATTQRLIPSPLFRFIQRHVFIRNVASTFTAQIFTLALTIASSVVIARSLGPGGKGSIALAMLLPNMLALVLNGGISASNVYYAGSRRIEITKLSANSMTFAVLATAIAGIAVAVLFGTGLSAKIVPDVPAILLLIGLLSFPALFLNSLLGSLIQGLQRIGTINLLNMFQAFMCLLMTVLLVVGLSRGALGGVLSYLFGAVLIVIAEMAVLHNEGASLRPGWDRGVLQTTLSFGVKSYIANVLQFFNYRLDLFIVNFFLGTSGVGIYSVSVGLAEMLWYFPNAVAFVVFPKSAASKSDVMDKFLPKALKFTISFTLLGALGLAIVGKLGIQILYSKAFISAYVPMLALLPGVVCLGAAKVLTADIAGRGHPIYNSIGSGVSLISTVILDFLLIPHHGVLGASIASTATYCLTLIIAIVSYIIVQKKDKLTREKPTQVTTA